MAWFWPILGVVMILLGSVVLGSVWIRQGGGIWLIVGVLVELSGWVILVLWLRQHDGLG